jgi:hypothetical protein
MWHSQIETTPTTMKLFCNTKNHAKFDYQTQNLFTRLMWWMLKNKTLIILVCLFSNDEKHITRMQFLFTICFLSQKTFNYYACYVQSKIMKERKHNSILLSIGLHRQFSDETFFLA